MKSFINLFNKEKKSEKVGIIEVKSQQDINRIEDDIKNIDEQLKKIDAEKLVFYENCCKLQVLKIKAGKDEPNATNLLEAARIKFARERKLDLTISLPEVIDILRKEGDKKSEAVVRAQTRLLQERIALTQQLAEAKATLEAVTIKCSSKSLY